MQAWSLAGQLALKERAQPEADSPSHECSCGLALAGHGEAYNEEAFRYLLAVERSRFEHSGRPFVLLLVHLSQRSGHSRRFDSALGNKVFAGLARSLRETDVIGWYRQERVVGALLTHLEDALIADVSRQLAERVARTLKDDVPEPVAGRLKVRLYEPLARVKP